MSNLDNEQLTDTLADILDVSEEELKSEGFTSLVEDVQDYIDHMNTDFIIESEWGEYRFIHTDNIDEVMEGEFTNEPYLLGCFKDLFIAEVTGWPEELIKCFLDYGKFEELGSVIIREGYVSKMVEGLVECDGYGHHFAHSDHSEHELGNYLVFRIN